LRKAGDIVETTATEFNLDTLQHSELTFRYGNEDQSFTIPGSKLVDWILNMIVELKRKQIAASLN